MDDNSKLSTMKKAVCLVGFILLSKPLCICQENVVSVKLNIEWHVKEYETVPYQEDVLFSKVPFLKVEYCNNTDIDLYFASLFHSICDIPSYPAVPIYKLTRDESFQDVLSAARRAIDIEGTIVLSLEYDLPYIEVYVQSESGRDAFFLPEQNYLNDLLFGRYYQGQRRYQSYLVLEGKTISRAIRNDLKNSFVYVKAGGKAYQNINLTSLFLSGMKGVIEVPSQKMPESILMKKRKGGAAPVVTLLPRVYKGFHLYNGILEGDTIIFDFKESAYDKLQ